MSELKRQTRTSRRKQKKEKIKQLPKWRRALRVFRKITLYTTSLILIGLGIGGWIVWEKYGERVTAAVNEGYQVAKTTKSEDFIQRQPTQIYDINGKLLKELKQYEYEAPPYDKINPYFIKGVIAVEDKRFYEHHGVDLYGTLRSVYSTFSGNGVQGGSTLTQQLVRNVILQNREVSIERKIKEQVVAQELEKKISKEEILQHYLNNVYFGHGNYGIGPASKYYFNKNQKDLKVEEVAVIIGITNNPSLFDPINQPENALKKRNRILATFQKEGIITNDEYKKLIKQPIQLKVKERSIDNRLNDNDAVNFAVHKATEHLMKKNGFIFQYWFDTQKEYETYQESYQAEYSKFYQQILNGGYRIETSIQPSVQKQLENIVYQTMTGYPSKTQTAVTTVDNQTGEVVAIVGGRKKGDYFNRAYQGVRQPGSVAKPIVVYANAFELGYAPQSRVVDSPIKNGPENWYSGYRGQMSIRYAIEQSVNTVAYRLAAQVGPETFLKKLELMQFSHLTPQDKNTIIGIGGFTKGVTTVEMASAYASLVRNGDFIEPTNVRVIKDIVTGETLFKNEQEKTKVFREDASYFTIDTLKDVVDSGTGKIAKPHNYRYVFGKTGTTNHYKDGYFVGGTPYYTTAIWVGYDKPARLTFAQIDLSKVIFRKWTEWQHRGKKVIDFKKPDIVTRSGKSLYTSYKGYDAIQKGRAQKEEYRLQQERQQQRKRLALEDYRIIHGLTSEEEKEREEKVERALQEAENFSLQKIEDYEKWVKLIDKAKKLNEEVKHQAAKDAFDYRIRTLEIRSVTEKDELIKEMKRKEEEERRKEEEKKREEAEIQRLQSELDRWVQKIENGQKLTKSEANLIQKIIQQLKEKGVDVPILQIIVVEEKPTPEPSPEPSPTTPTKPSQSPAPPTSKEPTQTEPTEGITTKSAEKENVSSSKKEKVSSSNQSSHSTKQPTSPIETNPTP